MIDRYALGYPTRTSWAAQQQRMSQSTDVKLGEADVVSTVLLVANGLSISYNPALAMAPLTQQILSSFGHGSGAAGETLTEFARRSGSTDNGFEAVLGSLDQIAAALPILNRLFEIGVLRDDDAQSLEFAARALDHVYRVGVSHSLETIDALSQGNPGGMSPTESLLAALPHSVGLTIATLNYDGILPSRLLDQGSPYYDMAAGYRGKRFTVVPDRAAVHGNELRDDDDILGPALINLHGSVGWLAHPEHGWWRFRVGDLRASGYWTALREGRTAWLPVVVLANQRRKSEIVRRHPFDLAYRAFRSRLTNCARLGIIGYGFGDGYLNQVLAECVNAQTHLPILVVTRGSEPTNETIRHSLGLPPERHIEVLRNGVGECTTEEGWQRWREATAG